MALYDFICHDCELLFSKEYPMSKAPSRGKCPSCNKLRERHWSDVPVHFNGGGYYSTRNGKAGHSDEVNKELQESTKRRMKSGWQHYAKYTPSQGYLDSVGARKLTEREVQKGIEGTRQMSKQFYDKAKIDPSKINKPQ